MWPPGTANAAIGLPQYVGSSCAPWKGAFSLRVRIPPINSLRVLLSSWRSFLFSSTFASSSFPIWVDPNSMPCSRWRHHWVRCEEYKPSRRSNAPTSPDAVAASASSRIRSL